MSRNNSKRTKLKKHSQLLPKEEKGFLQRIYNLICTFSSPPRKIINGRENGYRKS